MKKKRNHYSFMLCFLFCIGLLFLYQEELKCFFKNSPATVSYQLDQIPESSENDYIILNENQPNFTEDDYLRGSFENYSNLDFLGRCGRAFARIDISTMPTEERGSIGQIKPSGWHTIKYDIVNGKYLYNRCHLIGYQLTGENANPKNLITCTRQMNTSGMLEFENQVASYVKQTKLPVLYRVTPIFKENDLVAHGVEIEASSIEDHCGQICFHVFVYNIQDGITIDYATGESRLKKEA